MPITFPADTPPVVELLKAIKGGAVEEASGLRAETAELARARFAARGGTSTALNLVADRPGDFPNGPEIVTLLLGAGADPNALTTGGSSETPGPGSETHGRVVLVIWLVSNGISSTTMGVRAGWIRGGSFGPSLVVRQ